MKRFLKGLVGCLCALAVVWFAYGVATGNDLFSSEDGTFTNPFSELFDSAANTAIDESGVKDTVEQALYENSSTIASLTGLSEDEVNAAIAQLDIQDWTVTTLPDDAVENGTYSQSYDGQDYTITTYEDPSYVTVTVDGQDFTFEVPESAQALEETYL
jgi:hypothetical protein